jgi:hypothetical protein
LEQRQQPGITSTDLLGSFKSYLQRLHEIADSWRPILLYRAWKYLRDNRRYEYLCRYWKRQIFEYDKSRLCILSGPERRRYIEDWGLQDLAFEIDNELVSYERTA